VVGTSFAFTGVPLIWRGMGVPSSTSLSNGRGTAVRNPDADAFSCQLKCHDANGETYYVTLARESVRITSYEDDAVLAIVEAWADEVAALN